MTSMGAGESISLLLRVIRRCKCFGIVPAYRYGYGGAQESAFIAGNMTSEGLQGMNGAFFDLDMLPINAGYWDPTKHKHGPPYDAPRGQTLLTLWTIARSPLFLTELPPFDATTLRYLQNPLAMALNARGQRARVLGYVGNCTCKPSHGVPGEFSCPVVSILNIY